MADSAVNVAGYDTSYGIDAYLVHSTPTTTDYRQIVSIGGDSSGAGSTVTVNSGSLTPSSHDVTVHTKLIEIDTAIDTIDGVLDNILTKNTEIDAVLDTIKVDTEAIETAVEGCLTVSGGLVMSTLFIDEDASGDNPQTDTVIKAAPGSGNRLVLHGWDLSVAGSAATAYGLFVFTDGAVGTPATGSTNVKIAGRSSGTATTQVSNSFSQGIPLTANTALKLTTLEGSGNTFIYGTIFYTTEAV